MKREVRNAIKGVAKSRSGSPPISVQTIIDRAKSAAFFDELEKLSAEAVARKITHEEAREAAKTIRKASRGRRMGRHLESGALAGTLAPGIAAVGRGTKALLDAKKGRWGAARKAVMDTTRGGLAQTAVVGGLTGAGLSAGREGLQLARAKDTYRDFMKQRGLG